MSTIVPGYGDALPRLLIVDPAPDPTAEDRIARSLHHIGIASRPTGLREPGQRLFGTRIVSAVGEASWLDREYAEVRAWVRVIVALGPAGWDATLRALHAVGVALPEPAPGFAPGARFTLTPADGRPVTVLGIHHPADPGLLEDAALDAALAEAQTMAGISAACGGRG
ncbi:hypothetical protein [Rhodococcus daqingensis]|uniref:Uncharacterized protein n=1 Tax=Rhodococcus daqingensis TaxID=2479363 RepID=A0ABW2RTT1_9NOCA